MFGICPSANSLDNALGRINLVTAEDANELISIQFQEDVNSLRLAQRNDPCLRLILHWANAEKHQDQNPLRDLKIRNACSKTDSERQFWNNFTIQNSVEAILLFKRPWTGQDRGFGGQIQEKTLNENVRTAPCVKHEASLERKE